AQGRRGGDGETRVSGALPGRVGSDLARGKPPASAAGAALDFARAPHLRSHAMHPALKGLLVGFALGLFLIAFEYLAAQRSAAERGKKRARKKELDQDERGRIRNMTTFGIFIIPPLSAGIFWLMGW